MQPFVSIECHGNTEFTTSMKTFFYSFFLISLLGLFAQCSRDGLAPQKGAFEQSSTLAAKQSVRLASTTTDELVISVDSIQDSRCPINANCVWAGNAKVSFTASHNGSTQKASLCLGSCDQVTKTSDSVVLQFPNGQYEITLQKVDPYPSTEPAKEPSKATFVVRKK